MINQINGAAGIRMQAINFSKTTRKGSGFSEELKLAALRETQSYYVPERADAYVVKNTETGSDTAADSLQNQGKAGAYNPKTPYDSYFEEAAGKYDVPLSLLKAVAKVESDFTETAVSGSGAMGVMQLMPSTASALGVDDAFDPEQNIMGGAKYLAASLAEFDGDVELALAAYNAGGGAVRRAGGVPSQAVQGYVDSVMEYYAA